jgi:hypothetical protein
MDDMKSIEKKWLIKLEELKSKVGKKTITIQGIEYSVIDSNGGSPTSKYNSPTIYMSPTDRGECNKRVRHGHTSWYITLEEFEILKGHLNSMGIEAKRIGSERIFSVSIYMKTDRVLEYITLLSPDPFEV